MYAAFMAVPHSDKNVDPISEIPSEPTPTPPSLGHVMKSGLLIHECGLVDLGSRIGASSY